MEQREIQDMISELFATRQWTQLAIEWIYEIQQDYIPGELTPDKVTAAIQSLRRQRDELKRELETVKCLQESDHQRAEKWVKIADECRKEADYHREHAHLKDKAIQMAVEGLSVISTHETVSASHARKVLFCLESLKEN